MASKAYATGYEDCLKKIEKYYNGRNQLNILFTGQKNDKGVSWCPDCNDADPFVTKAVNNYAKKDSVFLIVDVGDRAL